MVDPHDLAEDKQALCEFASTRYAILNKRGIRWYVPAYSKRKGDKPHIFETADFYVRLPNENTLIADHVGNKVVEISKEWEKEWEFTGLSSPEMVDYDYVNDRVLISDTGNNRILEVDHETGSVLNEISSYDPGSFNGPRALYQFPAWYSYYGDPGDYIGVADEGNHYAALIDRSGAVQQSAGEYGVSGSDLNHLNRPTSCWGGIDHMRVSDNQNDRCLLYGPPPWDIEYVYPGPVFFSQGSNKFFIAGGSGPATCLTGDGIRWHNWYAGSNALVPTVLSDGFLMDDHFALYEVNYRESMPYTLDNCRPDPTNLSLNANQTSDEYVFLGFPYRKILIKMHSTESATLEILALTPNRGAESPLEIEPEAPIPWRTCDSVSLTGGEMEKYVVTAPSGVMAIRITMGGTAGTVNGAIEQKGMYSG